ncbi:MAG: bifunctional diaminohydroxyphosphoribosylaminopyrimidine deaminase/5-amino-6-(5-phosphoribosylamino)uracil reductase RibD [Anaerolineaceae bacterium]
MALSSFMQRALAAATRVRGRTSSNPWVGAVLVRDGEVIGEGATAPPGGDHAEAAALRGIDALNAELYVTLEPCSPFDGKRTPPCAQMVIDSGVRRVVVAMLDPDQRVSGRGVAILRDAGVRVEVGDGEDEAVQLVRPYLKHIQTGLPYVIAKFAASLDGRTATADGDSKWITGEAARDHSHQQRAWVAAVMTGSGTVLADDPSLTARPGGELAQHQPVRVILDSRGRTPASATVFRRPGTVIVATSKSAPSAWKQAIANLGANVIDCETASDGLNLNQLLATLGQRNIGSVWVEGGGSLLGSLLAGEHADEVWAYLAPILIGRDGLPALGGLGVRTVADSLRLSNIVVERLSTDILIRGNAGSWAPRLVS